MVELPRRHRSGERVAKDIYRQCDAQKLPHQGLGTLRREDNLFRRNQKTWPGLIGNIKRGGLTERGERFEPDETPGLLLKQLRVR